MNECTLLSSNDLKITGDGKVELGHFVMWTTVNKNQNNFNVRLILVCGVPLCLAELNEEYYSTPSTQLHW